MKKIKMALIGCGRIGRMHAKNMLQHDAIDLVTIYDPYYPLAQELASDLGITCTSDESNIFTSDTIEAVLIASATATHADFIEKAVAANKHILCEKPIDLNLERVAACAARIAESKVTIQIGFNRRFDPGHKRARDLALSGTYGAIRQVVITSRDPEPPPRPYLEVAGGLLRDMTIHDFDLARFLLNEEPVEVFALADRLVRPDLMVQVNDYDTATIVLRTSSGKECLINNSREAVYGYDQRFEILCSKGMIESSNRTPHGVRTYSKQHTESAEAYEFFFIERYREAYQAELDSFAASVRNKSKPEVGFDDGYRALVLAEACYKSIQEKRLVRIEEVFKTT